MPREILKWLQTLDLSFAVKNARRDFCSGYLMAEVLSRYYAADVSMHSYANVTSSERKKQNWALLWKLFMVQRDGTTHGWGICMYTCNPMPTPM